MVARGLALPGSRKRAFSDQIRKIPSGGRARGLRDAYIILCAETSGKTFGALLEHPKQAFFLPRIHSSPHTLKQFGLFYKKFHIGLRIRKRLKHGTGKIGKPVGYLIFRVRLPESPVISTSISADHSSKRNQRRVAEGLGKRFF